MSITLVTGRPLQTGAKPARQLIGVSPVIFALAKTCGAVFLWSLHHFQIGLKPKTLLGPPVFRHIAVSPKRGCIILTIQLDRLFPTEFAKKKA